MKKIVDFSVRHYQFTVLIFAMLAALGVTSWLAVPRGEDPTFPAPIYTVVAVYPGSSPADLEQLVVDKVEERMATLDRLKKLTARMQDGLAIIGVEFETSVDAERKYDEVLREVNALRPELPAELRSLTVEKYSSAEVNVVQLALVSERAPFHQLDELAERLERRVEAVPGVRGAKVWGIPERELRVSLDLGRLSALGIAPARVLAAIGSDAGNIPGGTVDVGRRRFTVKRDGAYASADAVRGTVVGAAGGSVVRLGDVAEVEWGYADAVHLARWNGRRAAFVTATQQEGTNIARVRAGIWRELDAFERTLPAGVRLERAFDQSRNVSRRLSRLGEDFLIAILLVLVTLLPLGTRASAIVMISIPLSLAIGVTLLHLTGFSVNQLSIVGAVIALGLLVDDSIVVVENIARFLREGHSRRDAAVLATEQIAVAVLGCTATLVLAFVPLLFLPGLPGRYIRSLPVAVIYTVLASLLVSMTIIPWLASLLMRDREGAEQKNVFLRGMERAIHATYAPVLDRALARPWATLAAALALVVASAALVPAVGFSLFPKAGTPQFLVHIETPDGASLAETDRAARFAERVLAARPEVRTVLANVGRDNPQIYYNVIPRSESAKAAQLFVLLDRFDPARTPALLDTLRARLADYAGARIELREFENGPPIDAPIALRLSGDGLDTLRALAARVERTLAATPGTQYVRNPLRVERTDLQVVVDRQKAGLLGVPSAEIDRTLRLAIAGLGAGVVRTDGGDEYDVVVRLPHPSGTPDAEALARVYVSSVTGAQIPLRQLAEVRFRSTPPLIEHRDRERAVTVTARVRTGFNTDRVTRDALARLDSLSLPAGYRLTAAGEIESRQESFGGIGGAVIVATFLILAILVLEFRTFRATLIVASVIPLGVVGGLAALWLTGNTLSFTAMIGFVALVGIEIKTSILLVDFTNQLRAEGVPLREAIRRAGEVRFFPILLTTMTAIGGLLPLALQGSALYSPLAWVIIGGLLSSTLLARLVTPVLYELLAEPDEAPAAEAGPSPVSLAA
ncbi:MAG TPA: efflux RND transporter permease subunit [Gemmatimonadaceae bacterium]|nr:efflux RND transporter permease subunit [Gemmatimonadaceae bacterium]